MIKQNAVGEKLPMRRILPKEIENMSEDKVVVVSRICINKRLMEVKVSFDPDDQQAAEILIKALNEVRRREKKRSGSVANVKMTVGDLKKAFTSLNDLPANSLKVMEG